LSSSPDDSRDPELPTLPDDRAAGEAAAGAGGDGSTPDPDQVGSALGGAPSQELEIVDVAAGGDGAVDVSAAPEFMPATEAFYVFDQAGVIARRRFALDTASLALVSFDADGTQTSEPMLDLPLAAAARGDELVVLELTSEDALVVVSYDSQLEHGSKPLTLAGPGTSAQALGGSVDQNVAVWSEGTRLHGQLFSAQGKVGDVFDFGPHSSADHGTAARAVWTGERFVVLWTRLDANGKAVLSWGTIDEQGARCRPRTCSARVRRCSSRLPSRSTTVGWQRCSRWAARRKTRCSCSSMPPGPSATKLTCMAEPLLPGRSRATALGYC
jgi:hypothetical protein